MTHCNSVRMTRLAWIFWLKWEFLTMTRRYLCSKGEWLACLRRVMCGFFPFIVLTAICWFSYFSRPRGRRMRIGMRRMATERELPAAPQRVTVAPLPPAPVVAARLDGRASFISFCLFLAASIRSTLARSPSSHNSLSHSLSHNLSRSRSRHLHSSSRPDHHISLRHHRATLPPAYNNPSTWILSPFITAVRRICTTHLPTNTSTGTSIVRGRMGLWKVPIQFNNVKHALIQFNNVSDDRYLNELRRNLRYDRIRRKDVETVMVNFLFCSLVLLM